MKDKQILKMLKSEVDSMTPNLLPNIKNHSSSPKKRVTIINEKYSNTHKWFSLLATCMVVIVAVLCISVPIILSKDDSTKGGMHNPPVIEEEKTADDVETNVPDVHND